MIKLVRKCVKEGKGVRIFVKDEVMNVFGSFKVRRVVIVVYYVK